AVARSSESRYVVRSRRRVGSGVFCCEVWPRCGANGAWYAWGTICSSCGAMDVPCGRFKVVRATDVALHEPLGGGYGIRNVSPGRVEMISKPTKQHQWRPPG